MNLVGDAAMWGVAIFAALLVGAAIEDGVRRKISNLIVAGLLIGAVLVAVDAGIQPSLWTNGAVLVVMLIIGSFAFSIGLLGGGDVKLLAATAFWFSPADLLLLLPAIAIAGGVLALVWLAFRSVRGKTARRAMLKERSLPYGIGIALGGMVSAAIVREMPPWA